MQGENKKRKTDKTKITAKSKITKMILLVPVIAALIFALNVSGALAYFTSKVSLTNVFTILERYTITYDLDGGTLSSQNPDTYTPNTETFTLNNPTKTGYTFAGWTGSNSSTPQSVVTITKGSTGNRTYTANWSINSYKLTVNPNGGTWNDSSSNSEITQNYNTTLSVAVPTRKGYKFIGWTKAGSGSITSNTPIITTTQVYTYGAGNATLTANWQEMTAAEKVATYPEDYYGANISNYSAYGVNSWRIFHSDGENIYLIATDFLAESKVPASKNGTALAYGTNASYPNGAVLTNAVNDTNYSTASNAISADNSARKWLTYLDDENITPSTTNNNMKATAYLMDQDVWNAFTNDLYADWSIGGPTLELFRDSYNSYPTHSSKTIDTKVASATGYDVKWSNGSYGNYYISDLSTTEVSNLWVKGAASGSAYGYWLASPSAVGASSLMGVYYKGRVDNYGYGNNGYGLRPIVCLKSTTSIVENSDGSIALSNSATNPGLTVTKTNTYNSSENTVTVSVTATGTSKLRRLTGWTLSNDKKTLTKTYTENMTDSITVYDNYGNSSLVNINVTEISDGSSIVTYYANNGTFADSTTSNEIEYDENTSFSPKTVTKYSHTSNVDDTGKKSSDYGNNWTNANITGTDRGSTSQAHVVTIDGATSLTVEVYYNGESVSYDWVSIWQGSHPSFTAASNYNDSSAVAQKLGGSQSGSYTVNGNSLTNMGKSTYTITGDTVTFGFKSDVSVVGQGYGYYAIITGTSGANTANYKVPTRTGYKFSGWNTNSSGTGTTYSDEQAVAQYVNSNRGDLPLYAKWEPITYTIAYSGYSATSQTVSYGETVNLRSGGSKSVTLSFNANGGSVSPTSRSGTCSFYRWYYNGKYYTSRQSVSNLTTVDGATVTMTASFNSTSISLPTPTRSGYTYKGWSTSSTATSGSTGSYSTSSSTNLYACWEVITVTGPVTITFDTSGTDWTAPSSITVEAGTSVTLPTLKSYDKEMYGGLYTYDFSGWTINGVAYGYGSSYTPVANVTAYVRYEQEENL